jgi:hypothetical protein
MSPMSPRLLRPRAAGGFDPRSLANLTLWLEADQTFLGSSHTGVGGTSLNSPVKYWGDKSGNAYHASRDAADSACPTLASGPNGRLALNFDGGDMIGRDGWLNLNGEQSVFAVMRNSGTSGRVFTQQNTFGGAFDDAIGAGNHIPCIVNGSASISTYTSGAFRVTQTLSANTWGVFCSVLNGASLLSSLNNGTALTAALGGSISLTLSKYSIGGTFAATAFFNGRVAEILVYQRALSDAERTTVSRYLGAKYGITQA